MAEDANVRRTQTWNLENNGRVKMDKRKGIPILTWKGKNSIKMRVKLKSSYVEANTEV